MGYLAQNSTRRPPRHTAGDLEIWIVISNGDVRATLARETVEAGGGWCKVDILGLLRAAEYLSAAAAAIHEATGEKVQGFVKQMTQHKSTTMPEVCQNFSPRADRGLT